jgi:hypothetical protein
MQKTVIKRISFEGSANDLALRPYGWRQDPLENIEPHTDRLMNAPLGGILIDNKPTKRLHLEIHVESYTIDGEKRDLLKLLFRSEANRAVLWAKTLGGKKLPADDFFLAARIFANLSRLDRFNQRPLTNPTEYHRRTHQSLQTMHSDATDIFTKLIEQDDQGRRLTLLDQGRGQKGKLAQSIFTLCAFSLR